MAVHRSLHIAATAAPLGTQPIDARLAMNGLIANANNGGAYPLGARPGLFYDANGAGGSVVGTTATSPMTYNVRQFVGVAQLLGTATSGLALFANDGTVTVNTTAAPGSNSRIDVIWVRQHALAADGGADADNILEIGVTQGTAAASPTVPTIPTGAMALAQAVILSTTTQTSTAVITQVSNFTSTSGSAIPVRSAAERNALNQYDGLEVDRLDLNIKERSNGTSWLAEAPHLPQQDLLNRPRRILLRSPSTVSLANNVLTGVTSWVADAGDDGNGTGLSLSGTFITATYAGLYRVDLAISFPAGAGSGIWRILLLKNGTLGPPATGTTVGQIDTPTTGQTILLLSTLVFLAASDTLQPAAFQNSGSAQTITGVRWAVEWTGP
jgi:hypothetical protein